jgi:GxxExxY protein
LGRRGLRAASQQAISAVYDGIRINAGLRADLLVEDKVIVEIKSVEVILPVHKKLPVRSLIHPIIRSRFGLRP